MLGTLSRVTAKSPNKVFNKSNQKVNQDYGDVIAQNTTRAPDSMMTVSEPHTSVI